jgi:hypothetical protein
MSSASGSWALIDAAPEETIVWLLAGDPSVRWQTERDLLDQAPSTYETVRAEVATTGWGRRLLDRQDPEGSWAGGLYSPKWTSATYTLLLLRHCGLAPGDPRALRGVSLLWGGSCYFDPGPAPTRPAKVPDLCVVSMHVALAKYFGFSDPRVEMAVNWLLANQLDDGGWNCRAVRFDERHGSFHTSISGLEALAEASRAAPGRAEITAAMARGRAFFLGHRLFKSHRFGTIVDPAFTRLSFPPRWHYDILRGLDHFATTCSPWDERYEDALEVLVGRQRKDGKWPVQHKYAGRVWFDMEQTGEPSRWNTLRALRVLRWAQRHGNGA